MQAYILKLGLYQLEPNLVVVKAQQGCKGHLKELKSKLESAKWRMRISMVKGSCSNVQRSGQTARGI